MIIHHFLESTQNAYLIVIEGSIKLLQRESPWPKRRDPNSTHHSSLSLLSRSIIVSSSVVVVVSAT